MIYHEGKEKLLLFLLYVMIVWISAGTFLMLHGMGAMMFFCMAFMVCERKRICEIAAALCSTIFFTGLSLVVSFEAEFFQSKSVLFWELRMIAAISIYIIMVWRRRKKLPKVSVITELFLVGLMIQGFVNKCGFYKYYPQDMQQSISLFGVGAMVAVNQVVFLMMAVKCVDFTEWRMKGSKRTMKYVLWSFVPAVAILILKGGRWIIR